MHTRTNIQMECNYDTIFFTLSHDSHDCPHLNRILSLHYMYYARTHQIIHHKISHVCDNVTKKPTIIKQKEVPPGAFTPLPGFITNITIALRICVNKGTYTKHIFFCTFVLSNDDKTKVKKKTSLQIHLSKQIKHHKPSGD